MPSAVVIRVRCGMTGVRVGEAANPSLGQSRRRRRVSSSDEVVGVASARATEVDSDHAPLASPTVASLSIVSRHAYRGQRVGEASHPGPVRRLRRFADVRNVFPRLAG